MELEHVILAVLTTDAQNSVSGPVCFFCRSKEEMQHKSILLAKALNASVHEIGEGCNIIVKH